MTRFGSSVENGRKGGKGIEPLGLDDERSHPFVATGLVLFPGFPDGGLARGDGDPLAAAPLTQPDPVRTTKSCATVAGCRPRRPPAPISITTTCPSRVTPCTDAEALPNSV